MLFDKLHGIQTFGERGHKSIAVGEMGLLCEE